MNTFYRFLVALFTGCLTVVTIYWAAYGSKWSVIVYHLLLTGVGITGLLAFGFVLLRINRESRLLIYIYALSWSGFIGLLVLSYLLTFLGEAIVSIPLPFSIFWAYAGQFTHSAQAYGLSSWLVGLPLFLFPGCIILFSVLFRTMWWTGTQHLLLATKRAGRLVAARSAAACRLRLSASLAPLALVGLTVYKLIDASISRRLQEVREPIFMVFYSANMGGHFLSESLESSAIRAGYPKKRAFNRKNVILIIVDALRADHLPSYGYTRGHTPFLAELANTGHLHQVKYAFSAATSSFPGILSILRSKTWPYMAANSFALHDLLKDQGYGVNFILGGDHTSFFDIKSLYGKSVDHYFDGTQSDRYYVNDDQVLLEDLATFKAVPSAPAFYYFHLMSVHSLGMRHPAYARYRPADATGSDPLRYQNNYDNGITQADQYIRLLFAYLQRQGLLTNSLVVITADHGESLGEGGVYAHHNSVTNRETHIPLLIYDQDSSATYRTDHAIQADVAATIVDRLGLPIPSTWEGESLLKPGHRAFSYHYTGNSYAIIQYENERIRKYAYNAQTQREQLFDLKTDPTELHDLLAGAQQATLTPFRRRMHTFVADTKGKTTL